jgi:hypothetical protein
MSDPNIMSYTAGATYNSAYSPAANVGAVLVLGLIDSARISAATRRAENTHYQNCMVAQGWRVIHLDDRTGGRLSRLEQAELAEQLAPMIGAAEPEGVIERQFGNELTHVGSVSPIPTGGGSFISLSRLALPRTSEAAEELRGARRPQTDEARAERRRQRELAQEHTRAIAAQNDAIVTDKENNIEAEASNAQTLPDTTADGASSDTAAVGADSVPIGASSDAATIEVSAEAAPIDPDPTKAPELTVVTDPSSVPQDATLIVFRVHGAGGGVVFRRVDENGLDQEAFTVGTTETPPRPGRNAPAEKPINETVAMLAPPGRWRMESMFLGNLTVTLCMGSPAFELDAGNVVYVGDFNFAADPFVPDLTLAPAQEALTASPLLAQRLQAASYTNGTTGTCGRAQHIYAYEIPASQAEPAQSAVAPAEQTETAQPAAQSSSN